MNQMIKKSKIIKKTTKLTGDGVDICVASGN
jgi:hypothetical protein